MNAFTLTFAKLSDLHEIRNLQVGEKVPGLLLLSDQLQNGWPFLSLIGHQNILVANQQRASSSSLLCPLWSWLSPLSPSIAVLVLSTQQRIIKRKFQKYLCT